VTMSDHLAFTSELGDTSLDVVDEVPLDDEFGNPPQDETPVVDPDHPILTQREAWGWYFYEVANSVYSRSVPLPIRCFVFCIKAVSKQVHWDPFCACKCTFIQ
jgi:hypothetical protein